MRPQDRAPQGSLRVQRQTATVKRRALSPRASAAPLRKYAATGGTVLPYDYKPTTATGRKQANAAADMTETQTNTAA